MVEHNKWSEARGLLSSMLYNVYVGDLFCKLNNSNAGCYIHNILVNHFMYAGDIALLPPSVKGLQKLVNVCTSYGKEFNIKLNQFKGTYDYV